MSQEATLERSVRLFKFLRELTLLRSETVRSLDKYDKVLWFHDIPNAEQCFSVYQASEEDRSELWLEVEQPRVPPPPPLPLLLAPWIDPKDLVNAALEVPPLKTTIAVERPVVDGLNPRYAETNVPAEAEHEKSLSMEGQLSIDLGSLENLAPAKKSRSGWRKPKVATELINLADAPDVQKAWSLYTENEWKPWSVGAKPFAPVQRLYEQLFEIHHTLQKLAEKYELLLGVGCLVWKTPNKQPVFRHILTARASLHFEAGRGVISVSAPMEGVRFELEQDMLEISERPQAQQRKAIDKLLGELVNDFWNGAMTSTLLQTYVRAISARGSYSDELQAPGEAVSEPVIHLAPAIILRPRTDLHFVRLFDQIVDQIEDGQHIPLGVERLVNIVDDETNEPQDSPELRDEEVYFPLPANPDQREIAQKLKSRQGILVQGPPGTGKSHTIANLVCHLLALGKRVLVTSHTPRALTVLRDKFPADLKALCVSVVGDDTTDSRNALEDSVSGITAKHNNWNSLQNQTVINDLYKQLDELRKGEQWTLNSLRSIKEKDTYSHVSKFSNYSGTAQSIARRLQQEGHDYEWLPASPRDDQEPPLTNSEAYKLLVLLRSFDQMREQELNKETLSCDDLLAPKKLTELAAKHKSATERLQTLETLKVHESYGGSTKLTSEERERLIRSLDELISLFQRISKRPEGFAKTAAREITGDHDRKWRELLKITRQCLEQIGEDYRETAQKAISGIDNRDRHTVNAHAIALRDHLFRGGKTGFGPFRNRVVKDGIYLIKEVRVNGSLCDNVSTLEELIDWLNLDMSTESLRQNWAGISDNVPSALIAAVATFQDFCEPLEDGLRLYDRMVEIRETLTAYPALIAPHWDNLESIKTFRDVVASGAAEEELIACKQRLQEYETKLRASSTSPKAHPILAQLLSALASLDDEKYHASFDLNLKLLDEKVALAERERLFEKLRSACPALAIALKSSFLEKQWENHFKRFEEAWNWTRCSRWITDLSDPATFKRHAIDLEQSQTEIRKTLGGLAAAKAWAHTFKRLSEEERQHLISWSMAVKRIGKGTGKYAENHRRDARYHMEQCRSAIPAWIMPIHKVVESVRPGSDVFDVIIVDEASQSGPEALFLLYLGKQLVVVGDDKQISPDVVGLDRSSVDALREQFLKGIPHSDAIGVDHSFFDQAKIRYRGKIRLKEHFRCMPEIIQFSNNLCYSSDPLIPLRQFGGGRLTPVVNTVYSPNGYWDETSNRPLNIPEAESILNEIKRVCSDPAYEGKTIGVISLLNTSQQAKYIEHELRNTDKYITKLEYETRRIRVGDAYMFQGDERDIIFLSMVAAPSKEKRLHALTSDKDERRFNVAVSRARDQLFLFHSVSLSDLNPTCVRHKLLSYCLNPHVETSSVAGIQLPELKRLLSDNYKLAASPPKPFDSWFEVEVFIKIVDRGYRVIPQYPMNGYNIDLIVEGIRGRLAVECDGDTWHGPEKYDDDMARQRDLERCGMQFWRLRGSAYNHHPDDSLEDLWRTLQRMEIYPVADEAAPPAERDDGQGVVGVAKN